MTEMEKQLLATINSLTDQISAQTEQMDAQAMRLEEQAAMIKHLNEQVESLLRKRYGTSSEKTPKKNARLEGNGKKQAKVVQGARPRPRPKGHKSASMEHLDSVDTLIALSENEAMCESCGQEMTPTGKKFIRSQVRFIPARLVREDLYVETRKCSCHDDSIESQPFAQAAPPKLPVQRSVATPSLIARIAYQKFDMGLPLYRQSRDWKQSGFRIERRRMAGWLNICSRDWLLPLHEALRLELVKNGVLHADETPYQILDRSDGKPATSESRIWGLRTSKEADRPIIWFHSNLTRKKEVAQSILDGFQGYLLCDGYQAYRNIPGITPVGCWAHARRKFEEIAKEEGAGVAGKALEFCNRIFSLERKWGRLSPEERLSKRQEETLPVLISFFNWLEGIQTMKGKLGLAVNYAINYKEDLMVFTKDGRLEASNNLMEGSIRPTVIGRKNFLFSQSEEGAEANAVFYTLVESAKANGLDPQLYLAHLLERLPNEDKPRSQETLAKYFPWSMSVQEVCARTCV